jgi:hypothetical protein
MLNVLCFYTSYFFDESSKITAADLRKPATFEKANNKTNFHQPASGTATIIHSIPGEVLLLTCAHIVDFPDTIATYFSDESGNKSRYVESVSIQTEQSCFIPDFPEGGKVDVISVDTQKDLAIVGKRFMLTPYLNFPALNYPKGKAKELEWGSFVYAFGYPLGQKMISKGIVSSPDLDGEGTFLIDAVSNQGFSGGIVLAIRDGVPNFELVGLVRSVPAETEFILRPENEKESFNPALPYKGEVYIERRRTIKYGVTRVIPIEIIEGFLEDSYDTIEDRGYEPLTNF